MALTEQEIEGEILNHQRKGASQQEISWLRAQQQLVLQQRKQQALVSAQQTEFLNAGANQAVSGTPAFITGATVANQVVEGSEQQFAGALQPMADEIVKTE